MRFEALLKATSELLADRDMREIGIYDIARHANVPAGSAYHFFPKPESAFLELARRRLLELREYGHRPLDPDVHAQVQNWPDLLILRFERSATYYNRDAVARQLFLSGNVISEIRKADTEHTVVAAVGVYDWLNRYVTMPYLPQRDVKFTTVMAIYDGVWAASCARHNLITESLQAEANRAATAYCRTFLPDILPMRSPEEVEQLNPLSAVC